MYDKITECHTKFFMTNLTVIKHQNYVLSFTQVKTVKSREFYVNSGSVQLIHSVEIIIYVHKCKEKSLIIYICVQLYVT
jgi:hypothetical protein